MIRKMSFFVLVSLFCVPFLAGCSTDTPQRVATEKQTRESQNKDPVTINIGLTNETLKPLFEDVYERQLASLSGIKELQFQSVEASNPTQACERKMDFLFLERALRQSEEETCRKNQFKPVDFKLATLKDTGDTVFLYTNQKILNRKDVRNYLKSVFAEMSEPLPEVARYQPADTDLVNRNRGLLLYHTN